MRIAYKNFTGGEVSQTLTARYDLSRFGTSVLRMANFTPGLHGDVQRRPGLRFVGDLGRYSILIPFSFNVDAAQNFALIFSDKLLRVSDGQRLLDVSVVIPYAETDLLGLSYAQVGDVVYLAHVNYPLHKVMRTGSPGAYQWSIQQVALNTSLVAPGAPTVSFERNNPDDDAELSYTLRYKVVAVDENGRESLASPAGETQGKHPSDWVTGNQVRISWAAVSGAKEYNVYREEAGYYGFIGVADSSQVQTESTTNTVYAVSVGGLIFSKTGVGLKGIVNSGTEGNSSISIIESEGSNAFYHAGSSQILVRVSTLSGTWYLVNNVPSSFIGDYSSYKAYREFGTSFDYPEGISGDLAAVPQFNTTHTYAQYFIDSNYEADTADTPKEDWNPFADGNNPATVAFHQQRMILGGTKSSPQSFYASRTGDFENFRKSRPLQDDDPIEYVLASGSIDAIQWIQSFGDLLIGTSGAEYKVTGDNGVITPKNVSIVSQSHWGSSGGLTPLIIGNSIMHVQRHGARVRDLFYSLEKDGYSGNDLSIMAPHLFDGHSILQWAYQQTPGSNIWCVRDDGVLLCLTYMKEHDIFGWSQHITDGKFVSVMSMSGDDSDVIMCVVKRSVGGVEHWFLERMAEPFMPMTAIEDAFFVDCGVTRSSAEPVEVVSGLGHLEGREVSVLADGSPVEGMVVKNGSITLPYAAKKVQVGLRFSSVLALLPVEADTQAGSTLGKMRAYGKCLVRLFRSVGGKYGSREDELYDLSFLPSYYGEPCEPFSGDIEFNPNSGQEADTTVWLVQDRPMPFHVVSVMCSVDFGEV